MKQAINIASHGFSDRRARTMINDLVPEIRKNMQVIARERSRSNRSKQILEAEGNSAT